MDVFCDYCGTPHKVTAVGICAKTYFPVLLHEEDCMLRGGFFDSTVVERETGRRLSLPEVTARARALPFVGLCP